MRLFLVQHGRAMTEEQDPARPLTRRGASDVRHVMQLATRFGCGTVERIVHSGRTRAEQTAQIWAEALGVPAEVADALAPLDDPAIWASRVETETEDLMVVGHLPHLARLAGLLITGDPDNTIVEFHQGGVVGLTPGPDGWRTWLILPPPGG